MSAYSVLQEGNGADLFKAVFPLFFPPFVQLGRGDRSNCDDDEKIFS